MIAYKLLRKRKNGTLGPLFINRKQIVPVGQWLPAESHYTKGYQYRPGWHATVEKNAPHLRQTGDRVWCKVELQDYQFFYRPLSQGGQWVLAKWMRVLEELQ